MGALFAGSECIIEKAPPTPLPQRPCLSLPTAHQGPKQLRARCRRLATARPAGLLAARCAPGCLRHASDVSPATRRGDVGLRLGVPRSVSRQFGCAPVMHLRPALRRCAPGTTCTTPSARDASRGQCLPDQARAHLPRPRLPDGYWAPHSLVRHHLAPKPPGFVRRPAAWDALPGSTRAR